MPIGEVLEKALKYPWKSKALWFYGILLAIFSAGGNAYNQYEAKEGDFDFLKTIDTNTIIILAILIAAISLAITIIGVIIASWSQAAICNGAAMLEAGKAITRKEIGKTGKRPVWKLIVLNLFIPMLIALILLLIIGALAALLYFMPQPAGMGIGIALAVLAIVTLIPFAVYWGFVWVLATRYVVLDGMNAFASLGAGRKLIKGKFWWTFLLGLVQGTISGMVSFIAILPLVFLGGAAVFLFIAKIYIAVAILGLLALLYLLFYVVVLGYFVAFEQTGWTIWWLKLKGQQKKIVPATPKKPATRKAASKKKITSK
jgi:hypothetical protein